MATVQSDCGEIVLFEDFSKGIPIAGTVLAPYPFGDFMAIGYGLDDNANGIAALTSDGLAGIGQFSTGATDTMTSGLATGCMFDVARMAPLVAEVRVRLATLLTKVIFIGFSNYTTNTTAVIEGAIADVSAGTVTLTATSLAGFLYGSTATNVDGWFGIYNGGTTDLSSDAVAGDFQILRIEIDPNGTARWYVDGVLKRTVAGAVSTTEDMCFQCMIETETSASLTMDVDYILVKANRDWTV
jgi:hypothetical protein